MKGTLFKILDDYLLLFPKEKERQSKLLVYLQSHDNK